MDSCSSSFGIPKYNGLIASQFQLLYLQTVVRALLAAVPPMAPAPLHMLTLLLGAALQSSTGNAWLT